MRGESDEKSSNNFQRYTPKWQRAFVLMRSKMDARDDRHQDRHGDGGQQMPEQYAF